MRRNHQPQPSGVVYAPLLGRMVECASLHVARFRGRKLKPVRDESGLVLELPVAATLDELRQRMTTPGRYRVSARDETSGNLVAHSDYELGADVMTSADPREAPVADRAVVTARASAPKPAGGVQPIAPEVAPVIRPPRRPEPAAMRAPPVQRQPWSASGRVTRADASVHGSGWVTEEVEAAPPRAPEAGLVAVLRETERHLRDQLREGRRRADDELREAYERADRVLTRERERGEEALRASEERRDAWRVRAYEAEVRLASASAWLEEREARIEALERQVAELRAEVASARMRAAGGQQGVDERGFSALDALSQMDQAIELIGRTAERLGKGSGGE